MGEGDTVFEASQLAVTSTGKGSSILLFQLERTENLASVRPKCSGQNVGMIFQPFSSCTTIFTLVVGCMHCLVKIGAT